jgi:hypothetical protein
MRRLLSAVVAVGAAGVGMLAAAMPIVAQQPAATVAGCPVEPVKFHPCALQKLKTFNPRRTADGRPDLQGLWNRTVTSQDIEEHGPDGLNVQAGPSLVVDTPDGRIPYQPWALGFRNTMVARFISPLAACFPPGVPRHVYAPGAHQILQTPESVVHMLEYSHAYRVIPTVDRPHVPVAIRLWQGDSRGRWEGNTLRVDVTNLNGLTWFDNAGNFASDALRVVERFTLLDADTIHYEARIEDPQVYTRPFTIAFALVRNTMRDFEIWEQACHEGNRSVEGGLEVGLKPYPGVAAPRK